MHHLINSIRSYRLTTFSCLELVTCIEKQISEEIDIYRKIAKKYKKAQTATHYTAIGLGSLSAALSTTCVALSLTGPGITVGASLGAVDAICGACSALLTNISKKLSLSLVAPAKLNFINALVSKSLNDNPVTDREFQIIYSELEKYFELKEAVRSKLKIKTDPGLDNEKIKEQLHNEVPDEFQKRF